MDNSQNWQDPKSRLKNRKSWNADTGSTSNSLNSTTENAGNSGGPDDMNGSRTAKRGGQNKNGANSKGKG